MPTNLAVTSYGYCYYVLIVANLVRSGISETDDDVGTAFNFAEHLAYERYKHEVEDWRRSSTSGHLQSYGDRFHIASSMINRLKQPSYGLID